MRRPQITIGRLILIVAVAAILTWGGAWGLRRWWLVPSFRAVAQYHAQHERTTIIAVREPTHTADSTELATLTKDWQAYHAAGRLRHDG